MFMDRLQEALPNERFGLASRVLSPLRQVKDPDEVALLRAAAELPIGRWRASSRGVWSGGKRRMSRARSPDPDRRGSRDGRLRDRRGLGPNSDSPHHEASDRIIGAGEPIVLDIGGSIGGYHSDITRTRWVTGGDDQRRSGRGVPPPVRHPRAGAVRGP